MRRLVTRSRSFLLAIAWLASTSHASLDVETLDQSSPTGVVRLVCTHHDDKRLTVSLGTLLNSGTDSIRDIALVTAHGLSLPSERCHVAFGGKKLRIAGIERGLGNRSHNDWAVLTLQGRFKSDVTRLKWLAEPPDTWQAFAASGGQVSVVKFDNGTTGTPCNVRIPEQGLVDSTDGDTVIVSDCYSHPGTSGGPALVAYDDTPVVIGMHIGNRYSLIDAPDPHSRRAGIIRLVDPAIERAIAAAIRKETDRRKR